MIAKIKPYFLLAGIFLSTSVFATNGYLPHGVGIASKGMGGVCVFRLNLIKDSGAK